MPKACALIVKTPNGFSPPSGASHTIEGHYPYDETQLLFERSFPVGAPTMYIRYVQPQNAAGYWAFDNNLDNDDGVYPRRASNSGALGSPAE